MIANEIERGKQTAAAAVADGDPHLRNVKEVLGYRIEATDGEIGHVEDLVVEDDTWIVRYLVVDTKDGWPGKNVLVSPRWTRHVRWRDRRVAIDLTRATIREGPEYDLSQPINREHEIRRYEYHGRPYSWT